MIPGISGNKICVPYPKLFNGTKDAIIIGTGQAAKPLSQKLAKAGWKILLVEKSEDMLGGSCLNIGCTPTKTLIASAQAKYEAETAADKGIIIPSVQVDFFKCRRANKP